MMTKTMKSWWITRSNYSKWKPKNQVCRVRTIASVSLDSSVVSGSENEEKNKDDEESESDDNEEPDEELQKFIDTAAIEMDETELDDMAKVHLCVLDAFVSHGPHVLSVSPLES